MNDWVFSILQVILLNRWLYYSMELCVWRVLVFQIDQIFKLAEGTSWSLWSVSYKECWHVKELDKLEHQAPNSYLKQRLENLTLEPRTGVLELIVYSREYWDLSRNEHSVIFTLKPKLIQKIYLNLRNTSHSLKFLLNTTEYWLLWFSPEPENGKF